VAEGSEISRGSRNKKTRLPKREGTTITQRFTRQSPAGGGGNLSGTLQEQTIQEKLNLRSAGFRKFEDQERGENPGRKA